MRPVTRDGAAYLNTAMELWGITEQAQYNICLEISTIYMIKKIIHSLIPDFF